MPVFMPLIRNLTGNTTLNVHYGPEAPADTSKLWVKRSTEAIGASVGVDALPESATVETLPVAAGGLSETAFAAVGTKIYTFGGNYSGTVYIYAIDTETQTRETIGATLPEGRYGASAAAIGTSIYILGGVYNSMLNPRKTIFRFDTETNTIETLNATLTRAMLLASVATVGTKIYLICGGQASSGYASNKILIFDTATNTASTPSTVIPMPDGWNTSVTACHGYEGIGAAAVGTKIYLFGGSAVTNALGGIGSNSAQDHIFVFDTETDTLERLEVVLPEPNGRVAAVALGAKVYLFGGMRYDGALVYSDKIYIFDTETNTITTSPTALPSATQFRNAAIGIGASAYLLPKGKNVIKSKFSIALDQDTAYLHASATDNVFPLISGDYPVTLGVKAVYVGDTEDVAELQEAYLYDETTSEWKSI